MYLISACLCGINCKYNGQNNKNSVFEQMLARGEVLPVCPEQLGGLATPRCACEIEGGTGKDVLAGNSRVIAKDRRDVTENFLRGAQQTLMIARTASIHQAILQSRSPSCGCGKIYDGSFSTTLRQGDGVTAALLKMNGLEVMAEEDFLQTAGK